MAFIAQTNTTCATNATCAKCKTKFKKMNDHRYINEPLPALKFDKNRNRVKHCPCGKDNKDGKFVPYVGFENKGYCHSCSETFLPELPKAEQWNTYQLKQYIKPKVQQQKKIDFIPDTIFKKQLNNGTHLYSQNHFIQWLSNVERGEFAFDTPTIQTLIQNYFLGNSNKDKYKGWVLFPYIDINGNIRDIKAMDYSPATGKRIREPFVKCWYIGKEILNNPEANTERCFYGEHLLRGNNKVVRIFESEATATYTAPFYPDSVCIATGGKNGCKWTDKEKCKVLQGRTVILYPDIDAHNDWEQRAEILRSYGIAVQVSQLIKTNALKFAEQKGIDYSELVKQKYDLRDILQFKVLNEFLKPEQLPTEQPAIQPLDVVKHFKPIEPTCYFSKPKIPKPENWEQDIKELEKYFTEITLPTQPVKLSQYSIIKDVSKYIESHFAIVKANNGKRIFLPYLNRLQELKQLLIINLN